jgi:hypothetical protein
MGFLVVVSAMRRILFEFCLFDLFSLNSAATWGSVSMLLEPN